MIIQNLLKDILFPSLIGFYHLCIKVMDSNGFSKIVCHCMITRLQEVNLMIQCIL